MRKATLRRTTGETDISISLTVDGTGRFEGTSGIGFFDHMLHLLARHSGMDISLTCQGDLDVATHPPLAHIGIPRGAGVETPLAHKKGIHRYGCFFCPMDETLSRIVLDLSGRSYLVFDVDIPVERIGSFETEMTREFFLAFANNAKMNLHMATLYGVNGHHIVESLFKGIGHALKEAVTIEGDTVLSTKGVL